MWSSPAAAQSQAHVLTLRQAIERFVAWEAAYVDADRYTIDGCARHRPKQVSCRVKEYLVLEDETGETSLEIEAPGITTARIAGRRIEVWNDGVRKRTRKWYRRWERVAN